MTDHLPWARNISYCANEFNTDASTQNYFEKPAEMNYGMMSFKIFICVSLYIQDYEIFASRLEERVGDLPRSVTTSAAFAYDAASVLLETWFALTPSDKNLTQSQFSQEFMAEMFSSSKDGLSVSY